MSNKVYMSMIAFIDNDASYTNDRYLYEFCKIALYQNGYKGLTIAQLKESIQNLIPFEYTEEDIIRSINDSKRNDIELNGEEYFLTSLGDADIQKRDKQFALRKIVDNYCDIYMTNENSLDRNHLCELITRFIFEKFCESIEQITSIIDSGITCEFEYSDDYSEDEKEFINNFLFWDNYEKSQIVYRLVVKSYDFCMINCPKEISFDFSGFRFYLDANIIMRLLGINNSQRQAAMEQFICKCRSVGIELVVSCYTKIEIEKSIRRQLYEIERTILSLNRIPAPQTVEFGNYDYFSIDLYRQFYEYTKTKNDNSINGFQKHIFNRLEECLNEFTYEEEISFEALNPNEFNKLADSLKKCKDDTVVKTDINNVLLLKKRRDDNKDVYMISADSRLITWCKNIFIGNNSLVEYPSVWLSIIMRFTGRATEDDYSAFCKFIRLPIKAIDKDIKLKSQLIQEVEKINVSNEMKDKIIEELNRDFEYYSEITNPNEAAQKAYDEILLARENTIREEERNRYESERKNICNKHDTEIKKIIDEKKATESKYSQKLDSKNAELLETRKNTVESKISGIVDKKINKAIVKKDYLTANRNRIIIGLDILFVIVCLVIMGVRYWVLGSLGSFDVIIGLITILIDCLIPTSVDAIIEKYQDVESLRKKYTDKEKKRYKALL
ncbi:MAG: hypothetical protein MJ172_07030 [Clostridia bacterium]|nr:hypothetical protein [Clostridia bacterium]